MSFHGPVVLISDRTNPSLIAAIHATGSTPVEAPWPQAARAIRKVWPAAVVVNDIIGAADETLAEVTKALDSMHEPYLPVLARVARDTAPLFADALPLAANATDARVVARLSAALRVRSLHTSVFRRFTDLAANGGNAPPLPVSDPLDDATLLVVGRGRSYPELTTAAAERLGVISAMNIETAARYLNARELDGVVIGEGFSQGMVDSLLTAIVQAARFRDMPVTVMQAVPVNADCSALANFERLEGTPADVIEWMLPLVRLHAYESRLQRELATIEADGVLDPQTGLLTMVAFLRELARTIDDAKTQKQPMSFGRFSFLPFIDRRTAFDAARLASHLMRPGDFAARANDGSIVVAMPNTEMRSAHVIARRVATALKGTMLSSDKAQFNDPIVTLAALKAADTAESLIARVSEPSKVAAA